MKESSLVFGEFSGDDDEGSVAGNFSNRWPGAMAGGSERGHRVRSLVDGRVLIETDCPRGLPQVKRPLVRPGTDTRVTTEARFIGRIRIAAL